MRLFRVFALAVLGGLLFSAPAVPADKAKDSGVKVDKKKRTITIDAKVAPRKLEYLKGEVYPIEVIACWAHPKGAKAHETVVTIEAKRGGVNRAMESLGIKRGKPVMGESKEAPQGPEVKLYIEVPKPGGKTKLVPIAKTLVDPKNNLPLPSSVKW